MGKLVACLALCIGCGRIGFGFGAAIDAGAVLGTGSDGCSALGAVTLCDGFEPPDLDQLWDTNVGVEIGSTWTTMNGAAIDTTVAHRGAGSLHLTMPAVAAGSVSSAQIAEASKFPAGSVVYIRVWVLLTSLSATSNTIRLMGIDNNTGADPGEAVELGPSGLSAQVYGVATAAGNGIQPVPLGQWLCMQFEVQVATSSSGSVALTTNAMSSSISLVATQPNPSLQRMMLGAFYYRAPDAQPALDVWFDDLILDTQPHGCDE